MRTIRRLIEAKKIEREENGEAGFSLIELIIVVVILGILVAVAIPLVGNLQATAQQNAANAAAANLATTMGAEIANSSGAATLPADYQGYAVDASSDASSIDSLCIVVSKDGVTSEAAGPAATAAGTCP